ncbi:MAG: hypothetical protein GF334_04315 [Candidatus Altiarchaeales archaeon]|nr:hypothetical protein [Candidatus Altiarchaeales archaeon]
MTTYRLSSVFNPVVFTTDDGKERIAVCQRDGLFEVTVLKSESNKPLRVFPGGRGTEGMFQVAKRRQLEIYDWR